MILVLTGTDDYRKRERRQAAVAEFGLPDRQAGVKPNEVVLIDADNATVQQLDDALMTLGLFATKQVVYAPKILKDAPKPVRERLGSLLRSVDDSTLLILDEATLDQRLDITKQLKKLATIEPFEPLRGPALERWVGEAARSFDITIEPPARSTLIERLGNDSWQLSRELEKLAAYAASASPPRITVAMVQAYTPAQTAPSSFALTDALTAGNAAKARLTLMRLLQHGEEPIRLLGLVAFHLRSLALVKDSLETGVPAKLNPFVVKKLAPQAQMTTWQTLTQWYTQLAQYDHAVKTGRIDPPLALELTVQALTATE